MSTRPSSPPSVELVDEGLCTLSLRKAWQPVPEQMVMQGLSHRERREARSCTLSRSAIEFSLGTPGSFPLPCSVGSS